MSNLFQKLENIKRGAKIASTHFLDRGIMGGSTSVSEQDANEDATKSLVETANSMYAQGLRPTTSFLVLRQPIPTRRLLLLCSTLALCCVQ